MTRAAALAALLLVAACGASGGDGRPTVFAAASLREVFTALEQDARFSFAGSDELATQIREGAPADVYAAASARFPDELFAQGLVDEPRVFATNRLVLAVPSDNPAAIRSLEDLREPGVRLVVADAGVPVGDYTRDTLAAAGASDVLAHVVSNEQDAKGVLAKVAAGDADAGFVYATDASADGEVAAIELPAGVQSQIRYAIAVVSSAREPEAARAFVELVLGPDGRGALAAAGFGVP